MFFIGDDVDDGVSLELHGVQLRRVPSNAPSRAPKGDGSVLTALALLATATTVAHGAPMLTTLATFNGTGNGATPVAGVIVDKTGNLDGTTSGGGSTGDGTVFSLPMSGGAITTLATFSRATTGYRPSAGLIADAAGNLYGTAPYGGTGGSGTVFRVPAGGGTIKVLAAFDNQYSHGTTPSGGLVADGNGNLYGVTSTGNNVYTVPAAGGTLSNVALLGTATTGYAPHGTLIFDAAGLNVYGTTNLSGPTVVDGGTVFKVPKLGGAVTTLASFGSSGTNGYMPNAGLVADGAGNLYGTTLGGGLNNLGVVYRVPAAGGAVSVLASFDSASGTNAQSTLLLDGVGDLFGTAVRGGPNDDGTVFEVPAGAHAIVTLATFDGSMGANPGSALAVDGSGNLYGTTSTGGANNFGTVFELSGAAYVLPAVTVAAGKAYHFSPTNGSTGVQARAVAGLTIAAGGTATLDAAADSDTRQVLVVTGTSLALARSSGLWSGTIDLGNNDLILSQGTSLPTTTDQARQGFAGGTWAASGGITSTTAAADAKHLTGVGVIQNAAAIGGTTALYSSFDGQAVAASDILLRYTYYGDTNLDGVVNAADYTRADAGYVLKLTGWQNGDFNYDGTVDGSDYALMDNAFNLQSGVVASPTALVASASAAPAGAGASTVPEPSAAALAVAGASLALRRRRSRRDARRGRP